MAARALAVCPCHSSGSIALSTAQPRIVSASRSPGRCMPSLCRAAIEQFRQLGEIDCHLPCLVNRQEAGVSRCVRVGSTVEHTKLHPSSILDGESALDLYDPPRSRKAAGHCFSLCPPPFDSRAPE